MKIDKRTLTNAQRAEMGLAPRANCNKRGPRGTYLEQLQKPDEVFETSPEVRLVGLLGEMFKKWADRGIAI